MSRPVSKNAIVREIEQALSTGSPDRRIKILMSITDLFIAGASRFSAVDTRLFDDVFGQLMKQVESTALVELSMRLAGLPNAPMDTIQSLARHDAIEVSGPVLTQSERLSDDDLIEIAQTKSQAHMVNIARRRRINEPVTEVLVDHGNDDVANEVAANGGARMSKLTMAKLVMRADGDDRLAQAIAQRDDISSAMLRQLLLQATQEVRDKLLASVMPDQQAAMRQVFDEISIQVTQAPSPARDYAQAQRVVARFSQDTEQTRQKIMEFADNGRIAEMIAALSVLGGVPLDQVDCLFESSNAFGRMVLCKSIGLDWNTAIAVITAELELAGSQDALCEQFEELTPQSAQKLIHFWLGRQRIFRRISASPRL